MKKWTPNTPVTKDGRRQFTVWQKRLILREHLEQGVSISLLARKYQVHPVTIYQWKRMVDLAGDPKDPHASIDELLAEMDRLKKENHRLKLTVGDLSVEKLCQQEIIESLKKRSRDKLLERSRESLSRKAVPSNASVESSDEADSGFTTSSPILGGRSQ
jgi:transposase-like protein